MEQNKDEEEIRDAFNLAHPTTSLFSADLFNKDKPVDSKTNYESRKYQGYAMSKRQKKKLEITSKYYDI